MASSRVAKGRGRPGETVFEGRQYSDSRIAGMEAVFMELHRRAASVARTGEWRGANAPADGQPPLPLLGWQRACVRSTKEYLFDPFRATVR
jgi:hypothetical protein